MKDPREFLSRKTAHAGVESPEFLAAMEGRKYIPQTYGNLASKLIEDGHVNSAEEAAEFLCIPRRDLTDPVLICDSPSNTSTYENQVISGATDAYKEKNKPLLQPLVSFLKQKMEDWETPKAPEIANRLHRKISEIPQEERDWSTKLLMLQRGAYDSETVVSLPDFVREVLDFEDQSYYSKEELCEMIGTMIQTLMDRYGLSKDEQAQIPTQSVLIGEDQMLDFIYSLSERYGNAAHKAGTERWAIIRKYIRPRKPTEFAPFTDDRLQLANFMLGLTRLI